MSFHTFSQTTFKRTYTRSLTRSLTHLHRSPECASKSVVGGGERERLNLKVQGTNVYFKSLSSFAKRTKKEKNQVVFQHFCQDSHELKQKKKPSEMFTKNFVFRKKKNHIKEFVRSFVGWLLHFGGVENKNL